MLADADLRRIVEASSTLAERATGAFVPGPPAANASTLERLEDRVARGDPMRFERYLRWSGWDRAHIASAIEGVAYVGAALPTWAAVLDELSTSSDGVGCETADDSFEEAITPFVAVAARRLRACAPVDDPAVAQARTGFESSLRRQLVWIAQRTLSAEFGGFQVAVANGYGAPGLTAAAAAYCAHLRTRDWPRVLTTYPVLARLLATRVADWVTTTAQWVRRVRMDRPQLDATFGDGRALGPVVDVLDGLSDPHDGGQMVCCVTFASGRRVVYKPRSLRIDHAFAALVGWLNDGRLSLPLAAPAVLDRGTHGWMACVAPADCVDLQAVERYYRRTGMLLCLAYVLGASDLHHGNVIASGEHPVLIDLETLMGAPSKPDLDLQAHDTHGRQIWDSLLRTGLLPLSRAGLRGRRHRSGGLVPADRGGAINVPHVSGAPVPVADHVQSVLDGFLEMAASLREARSQLAAPDGPLAAFRGARTRIVLRDTAVYAALIERALHPIRLRDGAAWSAEFELLAGRATAHTTPRVAWSTSRAEQQALARLDVPLFVSRSDTTGIAAAGQPLADAFLTESGFDAALTQLAELDAETTRVHAQCIRIALGERPAAPAGDAGQPWSAHARRIADTLRATADTSRGVDWIGVRRADARAGRGLQRIGWDMYGGSCGVALLFAALDATSAQPGAAQFARDIVAPLAARLDEEVGPASRDGVIGALGCGGVVHACATIARLIDAGDMLEAALRTASLITPEAIVADGRCDVIRGTAGAALGLAALYASTSESWVRDRAVCCGDHLLGWAKAPCHADGFAHGAAGVAYALARIYDVTGLDRFRRAALAVVPSVTDRLARDGDPMALSWCRGAVGIALARLAAARVLDSPDLSRDAHNLLVRVSATSTSLSPMDQLCCGNSGRIALLTYAADILAEPAWRVAAERIAQRMVDRAATRGSYAVTPVDDVFSPGQYHGLAGIGYELLRLERADIPSVLLWQ